MIETTALLRAHADLILRFSGAGSVSLVLTALRSDEAPDVVVLGDLAPVEELRDPERIRRLEAEFAERCAPGPPGTADPGPVRVDGSSPDCILFRIPVGPVGQTQSSDRHAQGRRATDSFPSSGLAAWLGLRFAPGASGRLLEEQECEHVRAGSGLWKRILALAATTATHTLAVSRLLQDPVTGLPTRAGFRTDLGLALDQAELDGRPLALLLVNPDGYAEVNRKLGRSVGDAVLAEVAHRLRDCVRSTDRVARYGGATFGIVLADIAPSSVEQIADGIRTKLEAEPYCDDDVRLKFSSGSVIVDPTQDQDDGDRVVRWIRRADEALFQAKIEGGARGRAWSPNSDDAPGRTVDRLQGMFTGDVNTDYRNMAMLWEVVQLIAEGGEQEDLCRKVTQRLHAWLPARIIAIVEPTPDGPLRLLSASVDGSMPPPGWALPAAAEKQITRVLETGEMQAATIDDATAARPFHAVPLVVEGRVTGCVYLEADADGDLRYTLDSRFFAALAAQLAVALDRARLHALERVRETEKREILESEVRELRRVVQSTRLAYRSDSMRALLKTARTIARSDATVLITGESGTGKELLAHTIHQLGDRRGRPLIVVDCSAISATLIDSELFGHEKGAFTGAHARKVGRLAQADRATVFLDEIGELPIDVQSKLLRFVQERQLTPVGGARPQKIDARIIAATNVELARRVRAGTFREDLFHRLNVVRLHLPPLRERREDILHLAAIFLQQYATLYRKDGLRLAPETERELIRRPWPGNVRELQNRIMRAVLFADTEVLLPEHLDDAREDEHAESPREPDTLAAQGTPADPLGSPEQQLRDALDREIDRVLAGGSSGAPLGKWLEADLVVAADRAAGGVGRQAGSLLGLADTTYRRRLGKAKRERDSGLAVRSDSWDDVRAALDGLVSSPNGTRGQLASRVERIILEQIVLRCGDDVRRGARLLGVTEPTYLVRRNAHGVGSVSS